MRNSKRGYGVRILEIGGGWSRVEAEPRKIVRRLELFNWEKKDGGERVEKRRRENKYYLRKKPIWKESGKETNLEGGGRK